MKIYGIKFAEIRPDLAIHDFYLGYVNFAVISFTLVLFGIICAIWASILCMLVWALFEVFQKLSKSGTMSLTDWFASSRTAFMMLTILVITYTKVLGNSINSIF